MMGKLDPTPWTEGGPSEARAALEQARAQLGSTSDVARLRAQLGALPVAANAGVPTSERASVAGRSSLGVKLGAVVMLGALAWAAWSVREAQHAESSAARPVVAKAQAVAAPVRVQPIARAAHESAAPVPTAALPTPEPSRDAAQGDHEARVRTQLRPRAAKSTTATAATAPNAAPAAFNAADELKLLMLAQDAIERGPQRALGLLDEHARAYPLGNFVQERESLAIDALRKLGRKTEARARAQAFLARFASSPHARRIERWLASDETSEGDHKSGAASLPTR